MDTKSPLVISTEFIARVLLGVVLAMFLQRIGSQTGRSIQVS